MQIRESNANIKEGNFIQKKGEDLNSKQRMIQVARKVWIETKDINHVKESAMLVVKLFEFVETRLTSKEMFGLSFMPRLSSHASNSWKTTSSGSHSYVSTTTDQMSSKFHAMEEEVQRVNAKLEEERLRFEHERIRMEEERRHETEAFERRMTQIEQRLLISSLPS